MQLLSTNAWSFRRRHGGMKAALTGICHFDLYDPFFISNLKIRIAVNKQSSSSCPWPRRKKRLKGDAVLMGASPGVSEPLSTIEQYTLAQATARRCARSNTPIPDIGCGRHLLSPPANWCPIFATRATHCPTLYHRWSEMDSLMVGAARRRQACGPHGSRPNGKAA